MSLRRNFCASCTRYPRDNCTRFHPPLHHRLNTNTYEVMRQARRRNRAHESRSRSRERRPQSRSRSRMPRSRGRECGPRSRSRERKSFWANRTRSQRPSFLRRRSPSRHPPSHSPSPAKVPVDPGASAPKSLSIDLAMAKGLTEPEIDQVDYEETSEDDFDAAVDDIVPIVNHANPQDDSAGTSVVTKSTIPATLDTIVGEPIPVYIAGGQHLVPGELINNTVLLQPTFELFKSCIRDAFDLDPTIQITLEYQDKYAGIVQVDLLDYSLNATNLVDSCQHIKGYSHLRAMLTRSQDVAPLQVTEEEEEEEKHSVLPSTSSLSALSSALATNSGEAAEVPVPDTLSADELVSDQLLAAAVEKHKRHKKRKEIPRDPYHMSTGEPKEFPVDTPKAHKKNKKAPRDPYYMSTGEPKEPLEDTPKMTRKPKKYKKKKRRAEDLASSIVPGDETEDYHAWLKKGKKSSKHKKHKKKHRKKDSKKDSKKKNPDGLRDINARDLSPREASPAAEPLQTLHIQDDAQGPQMVPWADANSPKSTCSVPVSTEVLGSGLVYFDAATSGEKTGGISVSGAHNRDTFEALLETQVNLGHSANPAPTSGIMLQLISPGGSTTFLPLTPTSAAMHALLMQLAGASWHADEGITGILAKYHILFHAVQGLAHQMGQEATHLQTSARTDWIVVWV